MPKRFILTSCLCLAMLVAAACAPQPSAGINWYDYSERLFRQGFLRQDRDPKDAPYSANLLTRNFLLTTMNVEEDPFQAGYSTRTRSTGYLSKWDEPIVYRIITRTPDDAARIRGRITTYTGRLAALTGLTFREAGAGGTNERANFLITYGTDDFYRNVASPFGGPESPSLARMFQWYQQTIRNWRVARSPCAGAVLSADGSSDRRVKGTIGFAIVLFRSELPDVLLDSCIEEELAQSLGPLGDDERLRPSMFNDDNEFGRLTRHDQAILQILYDRRLRPGMDNLTVAPIVRQIIAEKQLAN